MKTLTTKEDAMKLNKDAVKALTEKQVKEAIASLNQEPFFQKRPIRGKRHATKAILAAALVERVLDAADRGVKIPEEIDLLVVQLYEPELGEEDDRGKEVGKVKGIIRTKPPATLSDDAVKPEAVKQEGGAKTRRKISEGMTIRVIEERAPKRPGTDAHERFERYRRCKTVGDYLAAGGSRRDISFDRYHGRIEVKGGTKR